MSFFIDNPTVNLIGLALDATVLRQQAIAHNIANANTPGYRPVAVNFGTHMEEARQALDANRNLPASTLADLRPVIELQPPEMSGNGVALDMEVARLSDNVLQHQILLKALNRHFSIMSTAISEGKR
jgi:flagellar basal-body rod protein FlgB